MFGAQLHKTFDIGPLIVGELPHDLSGHRPFHGSQDLCDLDDRMLSDIGLVRTEAGELALADDPSTIIAPSHGPDAPRTPLGRFLDMIHNGFLRLKTGEPGSSGAGHRPACGS